MKKIIVSVLLGSIVFGAAFADEGGEIKEVRGKVEVKHADGAWTPAAAGGKLLLGSQISTGFGARAVVTVLGSEIQVQPLTRLTLAELIQRQGSRQTQLDLRVGRIKVDVKSDPALRTDFAVKSPVSTAAVRGTTFTFDGQNLKVLNGKVALANKMGWARTYSAGQEGRVPPAGRPQSSEVKLNERTTVEPVQKAADTAGESSDSNPAPVQPVSNTSTLVITW